jgi:hypothetical protein
MTAEAPRPVAVSGLDRGPAGKADRAGDGSYQSASSVSTRLERRKKLIFVVTVAILMFGAGLAGLTLRTWLPDRHAPEQAHEMIGAMTGLLGLLLALFRLSQAGVIKTFNALGS